MENYTFRKIKPDSEIPYDLLLLADETVEAINRYIFDSDIYLLNNGVLDIAVIVLYDNNYTELEIKNMAVIEDFRSKGIGSMLIDKAKETALKNGCETLIVGTSDTGFQQIRFYEKNGFVKKGIRKDFFIENYPSPIFENGLQMRDMVVLEFSIYHELFP